MISAVHLEKGKARWYSTERTTPDHKSIMNKYGKEVLFTPRSLELTNNKGMGVWIVDDVGIEIFSNKHVEIYSLNSIQIKSEKNEIRIIAPERILLVQGKDVYKRQMLSSVTTPLSSVNSWWMASAASFV